MAAERLEGTLAVDFEQPAAPGCRLLHRSHPLIATLADELLERALSASVDDVPNLARLARIGAWRTAAVDRVTTVLLVRLRHQLTITRSGRSSVLLVEEAVPVAWQGRNERVERTGDEVLAWLAAPPVGDLPEAARERQLVDAIEAVRSRNADLREIAEAQAQRLLADHRRVREAAQARGSYSVQALAPVDVMAIYVLLPETRA